MQVQILSDPPRVFSSVRLEHSPDKGEVESSNLSIPTLKHSMPSSSMAEQRTVNATVVGSTPTLAAYGNYYSGRIRGLDLRGGGSIPSFPTIGVKCYGSTAVSKTVRSSSILGAPAI